MCISGANCPLHQCAPTFKRENTDGVEGKLVPEIRYSILYKSIQFLEPSPNKYSIKISTISN